MWPLLSKFIALFSVALQKQQLYQKRDSDIGVFGEFGKIFKNTFSTENLCVTVSDFL